MSRVPSTAKRRPARSAVSCPAVAGFRPAGAALAVAAAFMLQPLAVQAQPAGAQVIHGGATLTQSGNTLIVTTRNGAGTSYSAIDWQSFSVPAGTVTRFDQPSASSTSINRVVGPDPSAIYGTLSSNGRLVLVNPAGIAVGEGAVVDTAAFTASTLKMSDADALAGRLAFGGDAGGALQVDGHVIARSGDVVLIAPKLQAGASALVQSRGATILAAGQKVEITGRGLEGIRLEVQAGNEAVNLGTLQGDAVGIFAGTLKHSGVVQAQAVSIEGGKVVLKATGGDALVSGSITAAGADGHGGGIDVLGQRVGLLAGATLDASGAQGGGQVRVGGDYQGRNPDVPNAARTYVDAQASIRADATRQGDGGRIIVWSDEATRMHGRLSARGGPQGGNGGFAEVSSKRFLAFDGSADLQAPKGTAGALLLDPDDITITSGGPTTEPQTTTTAGDVEFSGGTGASTISAAVLNRQLLSSDVFITTSGGSGGTGNITLQPNATISWSGSTSLGLSADAGISLQGTISNPNGNLSLTANDGGIVGTGAIQVAQLFAGAQNSTNTQANAGKVLLTNTGNLIGTIAGMAYGANAEFTVNNAQALTIGPVSVGPSGAYATGNGITVDDGSGGGVVNIATTVGGLTLAAATGTSSPANVSGGTVTLKATDTAAGDIRIDDAMVSARSGALTIQAGRDLAIASGATIPETSITAATDLQLAAGRDLLVASGSTGSYLTVSGTNSVTLTAGRDMHVGHKSATDSSSSTEITSQGPIALQASGGIYFGAPAGAAYGSQVTVYGSGSGTANGVSVQAGGDVDFGAPDPNNGGNITTYRAPVSVLAGGSILGSVGILTYGGNVTMTASNGTLGYGSIDAGASYWADGSTGGTVKLTASGAVSGGTVYAEGAMADPATTGTAGQGGTVAISSSGGNLSIGSVYAYGGDTYASSVGPASGGLGGNVTLTAGTGNVSVSSVDVGGGYGSGGGNGGTGGVVQVTASNGSVSIGDIAAIGGGADLAGAAGNGGQVTVLAKGDITLVPSYGYSVMADGGSSAQGRGGNGGTVSLTSTGGSIAAYSTNSGGPVLAAMTTTPYGGISATGGYGTPAGQGGSVLLDAAVDIGAAGIEVYGGSPQDQSGAAGGAGGSVHLRFGNTLTASYVMAMGGAGGAGTNGGTGGAAGSVWLEHTGTGDFVLDPGLYVEAVGGTGGDAASGGTGVGGTGGSGGAISLSSAGGAVVLQGPVLAAHGGTGGLNADGATSAATGALGTLAATATSVEIQADFTLDAAWTNTGVVNVHGTSLVSGVGTFANGGTLNLLDTAQFDPAGGATNASGAVVVASGANVRLNLLQNAGLVNVQAGSILTMPLFTANSGTLQVDGTLNVGDATTCTSCALLGLATTTTSSITLANQAGGVVAGSGTIALGGGAGTLDNYGTLQPGGAGSIGTLTLDGNLVLEAGGSVATDLLSTSSYDTLLVSGNVKAGGAYAVTYQAGTAFAAGATFPVLQAGSVDASTLPTVNVGELAASASGTQLLLVANAAYPAAPPPPPPPPPAPAPAPAPSTQDAAAQQVGDQVVTFAQLFVHEAQQQDDRKDGPAGKDDIVLTDNACKP